MKHLMHMLAALGLTGCAATDPLLNVHDWNPSGVNERNIAAQVVNPADLVQGREPTQGSDGAMAANAVNRLRTNHLKPLPSSGLSEIKVQATQSSGGTP